MGIVFFVDVAKKFVRRRRLNCRKSTNWRCGRKKIFCNSFVSRCVIVAFVIVFSSFRKRSITLLRCLSITAIVARKIIAKVLRFVRNVSVRNVWCRSIVLN